MRGRILRSQTPSIWDGKSAIAFHWIFGMALLVTAVMVFTPFAPSMPGADLDRSWMFAMNQAIAQNLVIGRDIVFTFGPYASIYTKAFHPATDHLMVFGGLYLGLCFFLAAYLNFRTSPLVVQALLVIALATLVFSIDPLIFFYPLMVGVLVCAKAEGKKPVEPTARLALLMTAFGLLPLIKLSAAGACLGVMGLMSVVLLQHRAWRHLTMVILVPPLAMVVFWLLAGQPLTGLPDYFRSAHDIIDGYTDAMKVSGRPLEPLVYLACATGLTAAVWNATRREGLLAQAATSAMFAGILFLAFKAGFTRHDFHAAIAASLILLAVLLVGSMKELKSRPRLLLWGVTAFGFIMSAHPPWIGITGFDDHSSLRAWWTGWGGVKQRILEPGKLNADFEARMAAIRSRLDLPVLDGTSDIYSFNQTVLGASGNRWNPRPVFQSYFAYSPELAERNKQHLLGKNRPDNLFFSLQPIDARLPALEDGPSWRVILSTYKPLASKNGFLILSSRKGWADDPLPQGTVSDLAGQMGKALQLPPAQGLLFARLRLEQSITRRLWSLLYKPGDLLVTVETRGGAVKTYRLIDGMAQSEFLLSPLIEANAEFGLLFGGMILQSKVVTSLTISDTGWPSSWADDYQLELTSLPLAGDKAALLRLDLTPPAAMQAELADQEVDCDGHIDQPARPGSSPIVVQDGSLLNIEGWMAKSVKRSELADEIWLVFEDGAGKRSIRNARRTLRSDVGDYFENRALDYSGFATDVLIHGPGGRQTMTVAYRNGAQWTRCRNLTMTFDIQGQDGAQAPSP